MTNESAELPGRSGGLSAGGYSKNFFDRNYPLFHLLDRGHSKAEHPFFDGRLAELCIRLPLKDHGLDSRSNRQDFEDTKSAGLSGAAAIVAADAAKRPDITHELLRQLETVDLLLGQVDFFFAVLADLATHALSHDHFGR